MKKYKTIEYISMLIIALTAMFILSFIMLIWTLNFFWLRIVLIQFLIFIVLKVIFEELIKEYKQ